MAKGSNKKKTISPARRKALADYRKARANVTSRIKRYEKQGLIYTGERPETARAISKTLTTGQIKARTRHIREDLGARQTLKYTHNKLGVSGYKVRHARKVEGGKKGVKWTPELQKKRDEKIKKRLKKDKEFAAATQRAAAGIENFKRSIDGTLMASSFSDLGKMVLHALQISIDDEGYDKTADKISDMWDIVDKYFSSIQAMYDGHTPAGIAAAAKTVTENLQGELSDNQAAVFDEVGEEAGDFTEGIEGAEDDKETLSQGVESQIEEARRFVGEAIDNKIFAEIWSRFDVRGIINEQERLENLSMHLPRARYLLGVFKDKKASREKINEARFEMGEILTGL